MTHEWVRSDAELAVERVRLLRARRLMLSPRIVYLYVYASDSVRRSRMHDSAANRRHAAFSRYAIRSTGSSESVEVKAECVGPGLHEVDGVRVVLPTQDNVHPTVRVPRWAVSGSSMPGFLSRRNGSIASRSISRIYVNIHPRQTPWLLGTFPDRLEAENLPFLVKTPNHPSRYFRSDTGVLYVPTDREQQTIEVLQQVVAQSEVNLRPEKPLFTQPVQQGISIADEPARFEVKATRPSHGKWVTDLVLRASPVVERLDVDSILDQIERSGRSVAEPHRRPRSSDDGEHQSVNDR